MSILPVYAHHVFSRTIIESSKCGTFDHCATEWAFDHCTTKCEYIDSTNISFWNIRPVVCEVTHQVFWNHFHCTTVESSDSELLTMVRPNACTITGNNSTQSHHGQKYWFRTFNGGTTITFIRNFRPEGWLLPTVGTFDHGATISYSESFRSWCDWKRFEKLWLMVGFPQNFRRGNQPV